MKLCTATRSVPKELISFLHELHLDPLFSFIHIVSVNKVEYSWRM